MPYNTIPELSFEFFPPSSVDQNLRLWRAVERLAPLGPKFMSVTYGAGGSTRSRTLAAIKTILDRARVPVAGHLTCVGASKQDVLDVANEYQRLGVKSVVLLRGDTPPDGKEAPNGFKDALELVQAVKADTTLDVSVAAYPEKHPKAVSLDADLDVLRAKADAGADRAITQFCFSTEAFLRFRDKADKAGISMPIIPGVLPVENFKRLKGFASRCGIIIPQNIEKAFANTTSAEDADMLATAICAVQCERLMREGLGHLHFYTLNKPDLTFNVARALGFEPASLSVATGEGAA